MDELLERLLHRAGVYRTGRIALEIHWGSTVLQWQPRDWGNLWAALWRRHGLLTLVYWPVCMAHVARQRRYDCSDW